MCRIASLFLLRRVKESMSGDAHRFKKWLVSFLVGLRTYQQLFVEVQPYSLLNLGVKWGGWSTPRSGPFTPGKDPVPIIQEADLGHRAGLDGCGKYRAHRDSVPGPSSPYRVAIRTELSRPDWWQGYVVYCEHLQVPCSASDKTQQLGFVCATVWSSSTSPSLT